MRAMVAALVAFGLGMAGQAHAAVRLFLDSIASGQKLEASEEAARKAALDAWSKAAVANGPQFSSWRMALDRDLACKAVGAGFEREARGRPCTIQQRPSEGLVPLPKSGPPVAPKEQPTPARPPAKGQET